MHSRCIVTSSFLSLSPFFSFSFPLSLFQSIICSVLYTSRTRRYYKRNVNAIVGADVCDTFNREFFYQMMFPISRNPNLNKTFDKIPNSQPFVPKTESPILFHEKYKMNESNFRSSNKTKGQHDLAKIFIELKMNLHETRIKSFFYGKEN